VRKQYQRNRELWKTPPEEMPVFGTIASRFNDDGVTALYQAIADRLRERGLSLAEGTLPRVTSRASRGQSAIVPPARSRYLADIAQTVRDYHAQAREQARMRASVSSWTAAKAMLSQRSSPPTRASSDAEGAAAGARSSR
jgi:methylmalonyl-CoA mutase